MLVSGKSLLDHAHRNGYAVGAFNVNNLEILQSVIAAALTTKSPVIVQTSEGAIQYAGLDYLKALAYTAAKRPIKMALHLDHGKDLKLIKQCIEWGWTSVMFDGSTLPYAENVSKTKMVVRLAHAKGVSVEAELGAIKGIEDLVDVKEREAFFTDPKQAVDFIKKTGIDSLAISIGTSHGPFKFLGEPTLDLKRLEKIKRLTKKPLVLHGASGIPEHLLELIHDNCTLLDDCDRIKDARGVSDALIKKAIKRGINKINIDSDLRLAFLAGVRKTLLKDTHAYDPRVLMKEAKALMTQVVIQKMKLFSGRK